MSAATAKWGGMPSLGFDIESTGVDVYTDRIVTVSLVEVTPGRRPDLDTWIVSPAIPIPDEAAQIHGYTTERAQAEQTHTIGEALLQITDRIATWLTAGWPLVAFNAAYDLTLLEVENHRHGIPTLANRLGGHTRVAPVIDPMVLANAAEPFRKKACACGCGAVDKTLGGWCTHYKVVATGAHGSSGDALAACRLWPKVMVENRGENTRGGTTFKGFLLPGLHAAQQGWRKKQTDSLRAYFDRQGIDHDGIDGGWPFHTQLADRLATTERVA